MLLNDKPSNVQSLRPLKKLLLMLIFGTSSLVFKRRWNSIPPSSGRNGKEKEWAPSSWYISLDGSMTRLWSYKFSKSCPTGQKELQGYQKEGTILESLIIILNWLELTRIEKNWQELTRIDKNWQELARIDKNWQEFIKECTTQSNRHQMTHGSSKSGDRDRYQAFFKNTIHFCFSLLLSCVSIL